MKKGVISKPSGDADEFWDAETRAIFKKLEPHYQRFLLAFVKFGKGSPAYREAINPDADDGTAGACAHRMLKNANIQAILGKLAEDAGEALYRVNRVYTEMTEATTVGMVLRKKGDSLELELAEVPDHAIRKHGADGLARIKGLNAPEKVEDDRVAALMELISKK